MKTPSPRRLSSFQRLMRGWAELAPYNFIHALRFDEPADVESWRGATAEALAALGLDSDSLAIERPRREIDAHLDAELNRGFAAGDLPLRFFVIETNGGGHWFGVVLDHWFADDFSCRALLERVCFNYRSPDPSAVRPGLARTSIRSPWCSWVAEWRSFFQQARSLRRACRLPLNEPLDLTVRSFRVELPSGTLATIRELARERNATVHDVFLAAAAQTCGASQRWLPESRRDSIGLVSAMDLRRFETGDAQTGFGLLISQYTVVERSPEATPLPELVARIAERTHRLKAISGRASLAAGLAFWRLARSRRAQATLYQRGSPLAAGLSNVNLSGSWIEQSPIVEFRRIGPTGPVVPLVFMITTLRGRIFIDTTYRTASFIQANAENLVADLVDRLTIRHQPLPGSA